VNAAAGRVPPHNLQAQAACLSAALLSGDALDVVLAIVRPEDCYGDGDAIILGAMADLHRQGLPVDAVTVASMLQDREQLGKVGGPRRLAVLTDATPALGNVSAHARIVADKARERRTIAALQKRAVEGYFDHGGTQDWLEEVAAEVDALAAPTTEERGGYMSVGLREAYQQITDAASRGGGLLGWPSGLRDLDRKLGGFDPGCVTVIGARPGMGKTSIALHMAKTIAATVDPVHGPLGAFVASLEMPRDGLARRESFTDAQVSLSKLKNGAGLTVEEWRRLAEAAKNLSALPLWVDDTPALSPMLLRSKARRVRAEFRRKGVRLALVVVDYLQLMNGRALVGKNGNREQEVAECSKALKVMAKELGVHVVALSQLNRDVEKRGDKRPQMADLRESGSVEQDADNILMLYREEHYNPKCTEPEVAEILVEKQRAGEKGCVKARFDAWCTRWSDISAAPWQDQDQ
jgi:replicative DNA helicase